MVQRFSQCYLLQIMSFEKGNSSSQHEDTPTVYLCSKILDEAFLVVYVVLGFAMFIGNTFCCAVFLNTCQFRNYYMNIFLVSLGVADILAALFIIPGHCVFCTSCSKEYVFNVLNMEQTCQILDGVKDYIWLASIFSLLSITYDRYLAVNQPLRYYSKMTAQTVVRILTMAWLLPLPFSFIKPVLNAADVDFLRDGSQSESVFDVALVICLIIVPMAVLVIANVSIMKAIKKQLGRVASHRARAAVEDIRPKENRAKTISCLIVVLVFLVSWFPRSLLNFILLVGINHRKGLKLLEKISLVFLFFQSSINPLLYSFYRKDFRQAAKKLLLRTVPSKLRISLKFNKNDDNFSVQNSSLEPALIINSVHLAQLSEIKI